MAFILCKTDSFQFSASPMPASVLARLTERKLSRRLSRKLSRKVSRFLRRRAASVLPPFHHASGAEGSNDFLGGQYGAASAVLSRGNEVLACNRSNVSIFRALFSPI